MSQPRAPTPSTLKTYYGLEFCGEERVGRQHDSLPSSLEDEHFSEIFPPSPSMSFKTKNTTLRLPKDHIANVQRKGTLPPLSAREDVLPVRVTLEKSRLGPEWCGAPAMAVVTALPRSRYTATTSITPLAGKAVWWLRPPALRRVSLDANPAWSTPWLRALQQATYPLCQFPHCPTWE